MTNRSEITRLPERGSRYRETINQILDAAYLAHVGLCVDGQPFVIPMLFGRREDSLLLHGSSASRLLRDLGTGMPACVTVTLVDGLVLARSAFHHSMNYRSVVAFGNARVIEPPRAKIEALRTISEHMMPGRWADARGPNKRELSETTVLEMPIAEASAKARRGPPADDDSDLGWPVWAGVLPLATAALAPIPDPTLADGVAVPDYIDRYAAARPAAA